RVIRKTLEKRALLEENERLFEDLQTSNRELDAAVKRLTALIDAGRAMSGIYDTGALLDFFIGLVATELDVDRASVMLLDEEKEEMYIAASRGVSDEIVRDVRVRLGEGIAGRVAQEGKPLLVEDITKEKGIKEEYNPALSDSFISLPIVLSIPIRLKTKVLGVINVTNKRAGGAFDENDMGFLLGLAGQAAVAIEGARHFDDLQASYESLKATQDHLVASERLKALGEMAAGVAHDFNNLLAGIVVQTQLLAGQISLGTIDKEGIGLELQLVKRMAMQGAETVKRIQDFTGIRKDRPADVVDLNSLVRDALEITRTKWKDEAEAQGIVIDVSSELGDISAVTASTCELRQVISNFIFNAVEAMPQGGRLTLRTGMRDDRVHLEIGDTGCGMSPEVQKRVFEPFFTNKEAGHGLGMSIAYGIIKRYRGETTVRSEPDKGTTFTVSLPAYQEGPTSGIGAAKSVGPDDARSAAASRVLLVEDNDQNRNLFETALKHFGHAVVSASSGEEALDHFKAGAYDLVITDLSMPGRSGWEVSKCVRAVDPEVPIILLSGWSVQQESEKIRNSGITLVVSKPCPLDEFRRAIDQVLVDRPAPAPGPDDNGI
ncbi:MAG: ATP-binding protein, partial [bacterium]|nr:ATP-binding protein [bacterium]